MKQRGRTASVPPSKASEHGLGGRGPVGSADAVAPRLGVSASTTASAAIRRGEGSVGIADEDDVVLQPESRARGGPGEQTRRSGDAKHQVVGPHSGGSPEIVSRLHAAGVGNGAEDV